MYPPSFPLLFPRRQTASLTRNLPPKIITEFTQDISHDNKFNNSVIPRFHEISSSIHHKSYGYSNPRQLLVSFMQYIFYSVDTAGTEVVYFIVDEQIAAYNFSDDEYQYSLDFLQTERLNYVCSPSICLSTNCSCLLVVMFLCIKKPSLTKQKDI